MNIHFFEVLPEERPFLRALRIPGATIKLHDETIQEADAATLKAVDVASVFIYSKVSKSVLGKAPRLKLVATRSTGFDHVDLALCAKRKITVSNVPFYGENTVAEHTFALILSLSRKVHPAHVRATRGDFSFDGLQGFDLKGKTIGVVGTGHIGIHAVRIAKGFGMRVIAFDVFPNTFMAETLGYEYVGLDDLLQQSDIITLHAPYRKETHHLINTGNIGRIKRGALIINTARGGLIETEALTRALDEGILSGAGLDVLEGEDMIKEERQLLAEDLPADRLRTLLQNHILLNRENVVITPHIAFNSREAAQRILETTVSNIQAHLAGKPQNQVALQKRK